jgi:hypothetical protein
MTDRERLLDELRPVAFSIAYRNLRRWVWIESD